jgi:hypothetical protein
MRLQLILPDQGCPATFFEPSRLGYQLLAPSDAPAALLEGFLDGERELLNRNRLLVGQPYRARLADSDSFAEFGIFRYFWKCSLTRCRRGYILIFIEM